MSPSSRPPRPEALPGHWSRRSVEWRAGALLVLLALLLAGTALYLMWARGAFEATQPLYLLTDDSDGVSVGMDLSYSGFPIGRVRRIELTDSGDVRIHVDVQLKDARWLRQSSIFTLEKGLVGGARLRAYTGILDDDPLPPEAERTVLRGDVSAEIPKMVADARDVLQNVNALTGGHSLLNSTLRELQTFTARLNQTEGGLLRALTGNPDDARRASELLELLLRAGQQAEAELLGPKGLTGDVQALLRRLDAVVQQAERQVLGEQGLVGDVQTTVRQLDTLLQQLRQTMTQVDAVLHDAQAISGNVRSASGDLDGLRSDVEASLGKIDGLITELGRTWPLAPRQQDITLP